MKVGDIVNFSKKRIGGPSMLYGLTGLVVGEPIAADGIPLYIEVLVNDKVVSVRMSDVEIVKCS